MYFIIKLKLGHTPKDKLGEKMVKLQADIHTRRGSPVGRIIIQQES